MKYCKLQNVFRDEKIKKEKVKIKTQNEKYLQIWTYGIIHIKKQLLVSGRNSAM